MNRPVLIVGGGPSGLSAAHALAAAGQRVVLVDKADQLGGAPILSGYAKLVPSGEWARDAIGGMVKRIESNKLVEVRKNATVKTFVKRRNKIVLRPENSAMEEMVFDPADVTIYGKVVSLLRRL